MLGQVIESIKNKISLMIGRALVQAIDDSGGLQRLKLKLDTSGAVSDVPVLGHYGLHYHPPKDTEAIVLHLAGHPDGAVVIATGNRTYRLKNLAEGEFAIATDEGDCLHFKRNKTVELVAGSNLTIKRGTGENEDSIEMKSDGTITIKASSKVSVNCDSIEIGASALEAALMGETFQTYFNQHQHQGNLGAPTGPPIIPSDATHLSTVVKQGT